jgi:ATP-binding protein involved in chromosome partitioning
VAPDDVAAVAVEGDWAAVVLRRDDADEALLKGVHAHLTNAFPATIEVRAGGRIFRGGRGFGAGRHVLAVLGGKGGVGKSTTAVNLGLTLAALGLRVGILDGDLNAPDIPHLVGLRPGERPADVAWELWRTEVRPPSRWRRPYQRFGLELTSIGFVIGEEAPPLMTSRLLVSALLRHLVFEVAWEADLLLIDAPPGTGHELQVMTQELPLSGAILVTTPQDLAQLDAGRTLTLLGQHGVPLIGLVQNMASLVCPACGEPIDLFARSNRLADAGLPVLGRLPFDVRLSEAADRGTPLVLADPRGPVAQAFAGIGARVRRWLATQGVEAA